MPTIEEVKDVPNVSAQEKTWTLVLRPKGCNEIHQLLTKWFVKAKSKGWMGNRYMDMFFLGEFPNHALKTITQKENVMRAIRTVIENIVPANVSLEEFLPKYAYVRELSMLPTNKNVMLLLRSEFFHEVVKQMGVSSPTCLQPTHSMPAYHGFMILALKNGEAWTPEEFSEIQEMIKSDDSKVQFNFARWEICVMSRAEPERTLVQIDFDYLLEKVIAQIMVERQRRMRTTANE